MSQEEEKPLIQNPSGFKEFTPSEQIVFDNFLEDIIFVHRLFGFAHLHTSPAEYLDILMAKEGGQELSETQKQVYKYARVNEEDASNTAREIAAPFDQTVPLARYVVQHHPKLIFPFRVSQYKTVMRGERHQQGRYKSFVQVDADVIGDGVLPLSFDAEVLAVANASLTRISKRFQSGEEPFVIHVNNRKLLQGIMVAFGVNPEKVMTAIHLVDKLGKPGHGFDQVSQDLVAAVGLDDVSARGLLELLATKGTNSEVLGTLQAFGLRNESFDQGLSELVEVYRLALAYGVPDGNIRINPLIARGLNYYTGTVYETFLVNFTDIGSVCSGGRYDNLASYFTDKKLPGVGISIGLTRLVAKLLSNSIVQAKQQTSAQVAIVHKDTDCFEDCLRLANRLRNAGLSVDLYPKIDGAFTAQIKYAKKLQVPTLIVCSSQLFGDGKVKIEFLSGVSEECLLSEIESRLAGT